MSGNGTGKTAIDEGIRRWEHRTDCGSAAGEELQPGRDDAYGGLRGSRCPSLREKAPQNEPGIYIRSTKSLITWVSKIKPINIDMAKCPKLNELILELNGGLECNADC